MLLRHVAPELILSGDDHDHCSVVHSVAEQAEGGLEPGRAPVEWRPAPMHWLGGLSGISDWGRWGSAEDGHGGKGALGAGGREARGGSKGAGGKGSSVEHTVGTVSMLQVWADVGRASVLGFRV